MYSKGFWGFGVLVTGKMNMVNMEVLDSGAEEGMTPKKWKMYKNNKRGGKVITLIQFSLFRGRVRWRL